MKRATNNHMNCISPPRSNAGCKATAALSNQPPEATLGPMMDPISRGKERGEHGSANGPAPPSLSLIMALNNQPATRLTVASGLVPTDHSSGLGTRNNICGASATGAGPSGTAARDKSENFLQRLMAALADPTLAHVLAWLPHGRSFVIIRPKLFAQEVMPLYFPPVNGRATTHKYSSFTRKLNRW